MFEKGCFVATNNKFLAFKVSTDLFLIKDKTILNIREKVITAAAFWQFNFSLFLPNLTN